MLLFDPFIHKGEFMPSARIFQLTLPVMFGYVPLGMAFSVYWMQQGLAWWGALFASLFLYAGSMQFLLVGLLVAGVDLPTVALATVAVNIRHVFYGLSFPVQAFSGKPWAKTYAMFSLTDEAFSVISQLPKDSDYREVLWIEGLCQSYWVSGTLLGIILGALIPPSIIGFDFALSALFIVLAQSHVYHRERRSALALGGLAIILALIGSNLGWFGERQILMAAISVLLAFLLLMPRRWIRAERV